MSMIAHYGCFEDEVQSLKHVPSVVCHMLHVLSFEADCLFTGQSDRG